MSRWFPAVIIAAVVLAVGLRWGTYAVGGSDSYCYAHQAELWASGHLQVVNPLALQVPWPDGPATFAPAGHLPSPTQPGAIVPICPVGLSIVMALFLTVAGPGAIFLVVPLSGALLILSTYRLAARFSTPVGVAAAALVAASPSMLFQLMQPMSDVPAAAFWITALACMTGTGRRCALLAGLATSGAILIRPNLLPLGVVLGIGILTRPDRSARERVREALTFAGASAIGCMAVALINAALYGSPFSSGYGSPESLFAVSHIWPNVTRYLRWLTETQTPFWLLALAAPVVLRGWLTWLLLAFATVNLAVYLPYVVFNDWWYLRFVLPAIAVFNVLASAVLHAVVARLWPSADRAWTRRHAPTLLVTTVLCVVLVRMAVAGQVFELHRLEARFVSAGQYVRDRLPTNALVVTSWQSGSVRFYSNRQTIVWDALDPRWLDGAIAFARERGFEPYLLLERWEEPLFRTRFTTSEQAGLDWPPLAEIGSRVRIYRPDDRRRFYAGADIRTDYVR